MKWYLNILINCTLEKIPSFFKERTALCERLKAVDAKLINAFNFIYHEQISELPLDTTLYLIDQYNKRIDLLNHLSITEIIKIFIISTITSIKLTQDAPPRIIDYLEVICIPAEKSLLRDMSRVDLLKAASLSAPLKDALNKLIEEELAHLKLLEFKIYPSEPKYLIGLIVKYGEQTDIAQLRNKLNLYEHTHDYRLPFLRDDIETLSSALLMDNVAKRNAIIRGTFLRLINNVAGIRDLENILDEFKKSHFDFLKKIMVQTSVAIKINFNVQETTLWNEIFINIYTKYDTLKKEQSHRLPFFNHSTSTGRPTSRVCSNPSFRK
ncbi:MAG: hypothetical protein A3F11_01575 [Gammaproteobacteria bacterium RIFCSPHIGHO2_12_FULL_37_14]|nr:MAG: hypothetical protein A3F11_01575 [Gammaproteobacteria bacterium RIFCSPHIGHO2_12_FULL_37_14]